MLQKGGDDVLFKDTIFFLGQAQLIAIILHNQWLCAVDAVENAAAKLSEAGARRAIVLQVGGAFHSPLMAPARERLKSAIESVEFTAPSCPVYQNVSAKGETDASVIKEQLIQQLTSPVKWTQTMKHMIADGVTAFTEVGGKGRILSGLVRRLDRQIETESV